MYRLLQERVSPPDLGQAIGRMGSDAPEERFPEIVAWMFPLMGTEDRVSMALAWKAGMPGPAFAGASLLIKKAIGEGWAEMIGVSPDLAA
jgi:hypothetical protein